MLKHLGVTLDEIDLSPADLALAVREAVGGLVRESVRRAMTPDDDVDVLVLDDEPLKITAEEVQVALRETVGGMVREAVGRAVRLAKGRVD